MNIHDYFTDLDLDVRKSGKGTFFDQKVTPDVLCAVAECIADYAQENSDKPFTKNDIWHSTTAQSIATTVFSKPDTNKTEASNEYDKFFAQPIKMLAYAQILTESKHGNTFYYTVQQPEILAFIAGRERNALMFIQIYLEKLLRDCGLYANFEYFFDKQNSSEFEKLKQAVIDFMIVYTPKTGDLEIRRIFPKILNPLAYQYKKLGIEKGKLSNTVITLDKLYYNRVNWRDVGKDKALTRKEARSLIAEESEDYQIYQVNKAKKFVRNLHELSEIHRFANYPATQAHHIFMSSEFPELAAYPENIIAITPNQHFVLAHPNNNTQRIDPYYQLVCLLAKLDSIEMDFRQQQQEQHYSLNDFVNVLNIGLHTDTFSISMGYERLKYQIVAQIMK